MYSPLHCITNGAQLGVDSVNRTNACVPIPTKKIGNRQETRLCVLENIMDVNGVIASAIETCVLCSSLMLQLLLANSQSS